MTVDMRWHFQAEDPMGGATGSAYVNPLLGTVKSGEEALAREAIQNSCDVSTGDVVRIVFRVETLEGKERKDFLKTLHLEDSIRPRLASLGLPKKNGLADINAPLNLTYVEDFGTSGLGGDPHKRTSNFYKLLLSLGDPSRAKSTKQSGGSYGYGKSALLMNSKLHTIVAYSAYKEDEINTTARIMGCGYFQPHTYKNQDFGGRAWFGTPLKEGRVSPFYDAEAHELADQLGFSPRDPSNYGTSLLILDSSIDPASLRRSIEDWWWPRIVDQALNIEIQVNGKSHFPDPKTRKDLLPFIECYRLAQGSITSGKHQRREEFNKLDGLELGVCGVELLKDDQEKAIAEVDDERLNCVALVRSTRMVVQYLPASTKPIPPAVGVFYADHEVDNILRMAEPPAHNAWEEDSPRLAEAEPDQATAQRVVRQIKARVKERLRSLQAQAELPKDQQPRHLTALEKELGSLLRLGIGQGGGGPKDSSPLEIHYGKPIRESVGKAVRSKTTVAVSAKATTKAGHVKALLRVRAVVLEDEDGSEGDRLPVSVRFAKKDADLVKELDEDDAEKTYQVKVPKDRPLEIDLATDSYDPDWVVKFNVALEPPEGA